MTDKNTTKEFSPNPINDPVLEVRNLSVSFDLLEESVPAVSGVDMFLNKGEVLGVVGESGCGKSVTAKSVMRIIPTPPGNIGSGTIMFKGRDLLKLAEKDMERIRGNKISMIFQEPMTSLNPAFTVGDQLAEVFRFHRGMGRKESFKRAVEELKRVEIPDPEKRARNYPHQLSGGMRQRVMIAIALACRPQILIADEPTTALDVTIQAQILNLISQLKTEIEMSVILITHNLGVVAAMADRLVIMYGGRVVEQGPVEDIFSRHHHPYTHGLLRSVPRLDKPTESLIEIKGIVPKLNNLPSGCAFSNRCELVKEECKRFEPKLKYIGPGHSSRCLLEKTPW